MVNPYLMLFFSFFFGSWGMQICPFINTYQPMKYVLSQDMISLYTYIDLRQISI